MLSESITGLRPVALAAWVPAGSARRHSRRCLLLWSSRSSSTFLRSLRSMAITPLHRYCGRSDSYPPRRASARLIVRRPAVRLLGEQVSLIHALGLPAIPSPNTCGCSASSGRGTLPHQRVGPRWLPATAFALENSELRLCYAGSPHLTGRIEFSFLSGWRDFLRTSRSPPAALHPVSPRRSCSRLQVTLTWGGLSPPRPSALSGARSGGFIPPPRDGGTLRQAHGSTFAHRPCAEAKGGPRAESRGKAASTCRLPSALWNQRMRIRSRRICMATCRRIMCPSSAFCMS